ncbi:DUF2321 domain-containing protein [Vallitalea pronyensis]|uniref:DUF2321 domain-containing protein n=1 Tax=Vallitalea pronyensis TaxID=1348613 RepID=A0A8J8SIX6_9FIRM|nr:DUF2321 domain-containing protein [Vallitalea pronyensis]QUI24899.1 DUF2321 domain-containing protein [Vallitalea pronyensis]
MGTHYFAQICMNGHLITSTYRSISSSHRKYCSKCGALTIVQCPDCNTYIPGDYKSDWGTLELSDPMTSVPAYCHGCGNPYPWTKSALESATLMINDDENLNESEKQEFCESLPDLLVESPTPKTKLAVSRFKKFVGKSAKYTADGIKDIFVDVTSEVIKKSLFPDA